MRPGILPRLMWWDSMNAWAWPWWQKRESKTSGWSGQKAAVICFKGRYISYITLHSCILRLEHGLRNSETPRRVSAYTAVGFYFSLSLLSTTITLNNLNLPEPRLEQPNTSGLFSILYCEVHFFWCKPLRFIYPESRSADDRIGNILSKVRGCQLTPMM